MTRCDICNKERGVQRLHESYSTKNITEVCISCFSKAEKISDNLLKVRRKKEHDLIREYWEDCKDAMEGLKIKRWKS